MLGPEPARSGDGAFRMRPSPTSAPERLSRRDPRAWIVLGFSGTFLALGVLFVAAPRAGAAVFGLPAPEGAGLGYVRAIGFRDLALALYLAGLALLASRRALALVLALTVLIPACDVALVATVIGLSSPGYLALHGAAGLAFAGLAWWVGRGG